MNSDALSIANLFDAAATMANERLRETLGSVLVEKIMEEPTAIVRVYFDLKKNTVGVMVDWPKRFGDRPAIPVLFKLPTAS